MTIHEQQVCGLAWAPDGQSFATGGNDNNCCFFYVDSVLPRSYRSGGSGKVSDGHPRGSVYSDIAESLLTIQLSNGSEVRERVKGEEFVRRVAGGTESWRWEHGAAVKAIAFCPWQDGLVATGGGSNDRCVHFFHTTSGTPLATIFVSSQVTSLIWSTTRREIAVTFGFAHPGHNIRIAVFSWPECKQVAAVPWEGKHRALYGISCSQGRRRGSQKPADNNNAMKEGCIAVASSDESIKFYELWPDDNKPITSGVGMLGGSDILEDLEGIQKEGDIIR
jgi:meiosis-specific APC/C activator protein AMA1